MSNVINLLTSPKLAIHPVYRIKQLEMNIMDNIHSMPSCLCRETDCSDCGDREAIEYLNRVYLAELEYLKEDYPRFLEDEDM